MPSEGRLDLPEVLPQGRVVLGLGIDLCDVPRIAEAFARHGERFLEKVYRGGELRRPPTSPAFAEHAAGLFAAKEAAMKALGTGMRGVAFREIAVARVDGAPRLAFFGRARERAESLGVRAAHVSITHTRQSAAAVVLLLGGPE